MGHKYFLNLHQNLSIQQFHNILIQFLSPNTLSNIHQNYSLKDCGLHNYNDKPYEHVHNSNLY